MEEMGAYVLKRHNAVAHYIVSRPILDLCKETVRRYGAGVYRIWWENEGLELAGTRAAVTAEADVGGGSEGGGGALGGNNQEPKT